MAKIQAQVLGSPVQNIEVSTVAEAKSVLGLGGNYSASVNTEMVSMDQGVEDGDFVTFTQSVKGNLPVKVVHQTETVSLVKVTPDKDEPEYYFFRLNGKKLTAKAAEKLFDKLGKALDFEIK